MQTERGRHHRDHDSSFRVPDRIPVFPLPNVVFFPRIFLPLHIFEPRYRTMIADAAADGQCIGMALLKEGWERDYHGNPPVFEMGCVGRLVSVQSLPDGRSNILLQGLSRYRIHEEYYDRSYRQASVVLQPGGAEGTLDSSVRSELLRLVDLYLKSRDDGDRACGLFRFDVGDEILVNSLSAYLDFTPLEKQFLLEADSLLQQSRRLSDLIQFKLYERDGAKGWG